VTRPYLSVIVPAYNEAQAIGPALAAMRAYLDSRAYTYEVIVVADGDDGTADVVRNAALQWPQLSLSAEAARRGKGHALRRGVARARGEIVGFLDGDYKTPIDEVEKLLPWFNRGFDLVAGSRGLSDSRVEVPARLYRRIGSRVFAFGLRALIGLYHIRDTQCGFKFFTGVAAHEIFDRTVIDGYMCDIEILWLAQRFGFSVKEVGVVWRDDADSRLQLVRGNLRNFVELLRIRFGRYPGYVADVRPVALPVEQRDV
jgi:glycosyltransferase involved in cell wall biosynthesis